MAINSQSAKSENPQVSRGTVMVLEDSEISRAVLKKFFEKNGYQVLGFENGMEALDYVQEHDVADLKCIMTDIMMPHVDGIEFLGWIKEMHLVQGVPVIVASSDSDKDTIVKAMSFNIASYIIKPVSSKKLILAMKKVFPDETFVES